MSRIAQRFESLRSQGRSALIPYIMAGDPEPWVTVPLMHALVQAGADIIELGVPFSDPMADGPVIQRASERSLKHGISLNKVLSLVREFRVKDKDTPIVLMGYLNPIEVMGYERFARLSSDAGIDGVLTVDLPPEEANGLLAKLHVAKLDAIFLLAPTSDDHRIHSISAVASGFVYYVSLRGVTGASHLDLDEVINKLQNIRQHTSLPLGVGFGINQPEIAAKVAQVADAVIVGSALIKRVEDLVARPDQILQDIPSFLATLRQAMDHSREHPRLAEGQG